jgi:hypothetical protein
LSLILSPTKKPKIAKTIRAWQQVLTYYYKPSKRYSSRDTIPLTEEEKKKEKP